MNKQVMSLAIVALLSGSFAFAETTVDNEAKVKKEEHHNILTGSNTETTTKSAKAKDVAGHTHKAMVKSKTTTKPDGGTHTTTETEHSN